MNSKFAALRNLVLPAGAIGGQRIVLDGVNGLIDVYDASGSKRIELGALGLHERIFLFTGDVNENIGADFATSVLGAGNTRRLSVFIDAPQFAGQSFPTLLLASQSYDGTVTTLMQYVAARHEFVASGDGPTDITLAGVSLPRGIMAAPVFSSTSPGTTTTEAKDTQLGDYVFTAKAGRLYRVMCSGRLGSTVAGDQGDLRIRDGGVSSPTTGSTLLTAASAQFNNASGGQQVVIGHQRNNFSAGVHTLAAFFARTAGTGNVTFSTAGGQSQVLYVEHL